jgi:glycine/serine hydroxymethyltransferase
MKTATCKDLRGPCDEVIIGETAEEMSSTCKQHVMAMMQAGDESHISAVKDMMSLSQDDQEKWYKGFVDGFESLENA